ncbi:Acyl transferase/acyl hydrolase/lysophospholipase [Fusarium austroafricanum]|uniref:Acyl transferase/acyl hydrolase/lysophospholipase n=1 Tax=Fusarium austroafricanum TaxID=2364996 RepID=A0A8H4NV00_9HYPO|nr:Acyl transferase/acyl hydrolase/lysophospholipase [Fusarium austroafricanum]
MNRLKTNGHDLGINGFHDDALDETHPRHDSSAHVTVPIAVVGMACRLPGHCNSPHALWEFLKGGGVAKNTPPASRFNLDGHFDASRKPRTMKSPGGMFMEGVDPELFDGQFFNISRIDCIAMDPQQRQLLEVTYECLENAGVPLQVISGKAVGCLVGANAVDYEAMQARSPEDRPESATIGVARSILSNRISHFLNIKGPSMTIDTACSSSLIAVDVACRYLESYQADGMIVAGANMWLNPEHNQEIGMMHTTQSASGRCHTFDVKADGYVKSEAVNALFLKRLDDAVRDKDPIRAVIKGSAANSGGRTPGLASPSAEAQASAIRAAYTNAGITNFADTGFLECHGTGTLVGDPIEVAAAASVFAKDRTQDLIIGSIKSNIGHSEAAAGISAVIKAVMAVESGEIPGNPTFIEPNPNINFKSAKVRVPRNMIRWPGSGNRRASINSFGFGGANAHVVLEATTSSPHVSSYQSSISQNFFDCSEKVEWERPKVLVFSANDEKSLRKSVTDLSTHLINPAVSMKPDDLAYTLSKRRTHHYHRAFVVSKTQEIDSSKVIFGKTTSPVRVGLIFTGQGAQWSQMGLDLVNTFPIAMRTIEDLDKVLQALPSPPEWSLLEELTQHRDDKTMRQPEFSQPLAAALQLAILAVLWDWNIHPVSVAGHSSGEIAAAAAAGLITPEEAITIAFLRGQAAKEAASTDIKLGMLAVIMKRISELAPLLKESETSVQIACYNSPNSVTLSGEVPALEKVMHQLNKEGHFARMLRVDLAYHSHYMMEIGAKYKDMLEAHQLKSTDGKPQKPAKFFSTVFGEGYDSQLDAEYWQTNVVSPVKFEQAVTAMLQDMEPANFLIEVGPSPALGGPIAQIKQPISEATGEVTYTTALIRVHGRSVNLFDVAGKLFISGGEVDLEQVNAPTEDKQPSVVIDLPNYPWNHSTSYWHESLASKDWRQRKFINHDLLGSKILGTPWVSPIFEKILNLSDMPWLRDHKLGRQVVFPGAGYVVMAIEAVYQMTMMTKWMGKAPEKYQYRLRDVKFSRAMVIEEGTNARFILSLGSATATLGSWFEFKVSSQADSVWTQHSSGFIKIEVDYPEHQASSDTIQPFRFPSPAASWYKAMSEAGYNFGPSFQKHLMVESVTGQRQSRSLVSLQPPDSPYDQSFYPIHPACLDGCFQTVSPSLWEGDRTTVKSVLVPTIIGSLIIPACKSQPSEGLAVASAHHQGVGRKDTPVNYSTNSSLYDPQTSRLILEMKGLRFAELETTDETEMPHVITKLTWQPDISLLLHGDGKDLTLYLQRVLSSFPGVDKHPNNKYHCKQTLINTVLNLIAHKTPTMSVVELCLDAQDTTSLWLSLNDGTHHGIREACSRFQLLFDDAKSVMAAKERYSVTSLNIHVDMVGSTLDSQNRYKLAIVRIPQHNSEQSLYAALDSVDDLLEESGYTLIVFSDDEKHLANGNPSRLDYLRARSPSGRLYELGESVCLYVRHEPSPQILNTTPRKVLQVILMESPQDQCQHPLDQFHHDEWEVEQCANPLEDISPGDTILILDEVFHSLMPHIGQYQLEVIKHIVQLECKVLWVTSGAHLSVSNPDRAAINGFLRVLRAEEPTLRLLTLDIEPHGSAAASKCIDACLRILNGEVSNDPADSEFVDRDGFLFTSRLLPDTNLTKEQSDEISDLDTEQVDLHTSSDCIRLRVERLGNLDSLHYGEVHSEPLPLEEGHIEVELVAAGLNYKDVVVALGIVPGNEHTSGGEGAGIVTRVSPGITTFQPGQRVVVYQQGTFANRIQTIPERAHVLPDGMSFEEAATLCIVYMTAIHSLFDMAQIQRGSKVLIHSAAGGVGLAAVQLCQYVGSQIYATVGTDEKRNFLKSTFGLSDDHIFDSRSADFSRQISAATDGKGVDVILNSLTGELLDESWRILADGGTMVEIGKRDMLDGKQLSMRPFDRNTSFRAVDLSHEKVSPELAARLLSKIFELIGNGHIKPITPMHYFSFSEVPSAIRFLRAGTHIGKVVITDGDNPNVQVLVRKARRSFILRQDRCYLIVGGLKGLCGSLAVFLAKSGARHLAVLSRSGHEDERSQATVFQVESQGCKIDLLTGDVTNEVDVEAAMRMTTVPVAGIIQGAMVLRIRGTWNLHSVAIKMSLKLDFFTMLSSISGVVGQKGQANYAAGNAFLDSFASYRIQRGLPACSIDLGVIEDIGYIHDNKGMQEKLDTSLWKPINERLLRKIVQLSILQQQHNPAQEIPNAQIITGIPVPQPRDSELRRDARFSGLLTHSGHEAATARRNFGGDQESKDVQGLILLLQSGTTGRSSMVAATEEVMNKCFMKILRLPEPLEKDRPISVYGIDSLAAVEVRNWIRMHLGALVTTLDIMNATSLVALCGKIIDRIVAADSKPSEV